MKKMKRFTTKTVLTVALLWVALAQAQDEPQTSNIQKFTPSKLMGKGHWDLKLFNNLYTQTKSTFSSEDGLRQNFFTATLEVFTGVSDTKRVNLGVIAEYRANGREFRLDDGSITDIRNTSGLTSIAPSIKFVPFADVGNFSILSSFSIPLISDELDQDTGVFLDQKGYTWQNRFFYDYSFPGNKWQLFTELNTEYHFGDKEESFANNSLGLTPGVFLSYFPSSNFTILGLAQYFQRLDLGNDFSQNYFALGGGMKYQLSKELNIEALYTNFVTGTDTGLGQTFNIGLRAIL